MKKTSKLVGYFSKIALIAQMVKKPRLPYHQKSLNAGLNTYLDRDPDYDQG